MVTIHAVTRFTRGQALGIRILYPGCHIKMYDDGKLIKEYKSDEDLPKYSDKYLGNTNRPLLEFPLPD